MLKRHSEAAKDLEHAVSQVPNDPLVLYRLGLTHFADENDKKCLKYLKASLKNKPFINYEADIYYHIGLAYCRVQKFEESIWPFSRCIERNPSDIRYVHERAKAH